MAESKPGAMGVLQNALSGESEELDVMIPGKRKNRKQRPKNVDAGDISPKEEQEMGDISPIQIHEIEPTKIVPWKHSDRPENEFGDMDTFIASIESSGQNIPALVRPADNGYYELIYGHRRLRACRKLGIKLKAFIRILDDQEAFSMMVIENNDRKNLSGWARCKSYVQALKNKVYKSQYDLAGACGISRSTVKDILLYDKLPETLKVSLPLNQIGISGVRKIVELIRDTNDAADIFEKAIPEFEKYPNIGPSKVVRIYHNGKKEEGSYERIQKIISDKNGQKLFSVVSDQQGTLSVRIVKKGVDQKQLIELIKQFMEDDG